MNQQNSPKKPQMHTPIQQDDVYDYHQVFDYLNQKYDMDICDFANSHSHFNIWCDSRGYGKTDPKGNSRNASQIWFAEYQSAPDGAAQCPPYLNFSHWLADNYNLNNGAYFEVEVAEHLEEEIPDFVRIILERMRTEFGDNVPMQIEW